MKNLIKVEYVFLFISGIIAYSETEKSWWLFAVLFFTPDISMIGYLVNSKIGAWIYNFFHHYALAIITYLHLILMDFYRLQILQMRLYLDQDN